MTVTPHVAQNTSGRSSAIDARTTRHGGYAISQRVCLWPKNSVFRQRRLGYSSFCFLLHRDCRSHSLYRRCNRNATDYGNLSASDGRIASGSTPPTAKILGQPRKRTTWLASQPPTVKPIATPAVIEITRRPWAIGGAKSEASAIVSGMPPVCGVVLFLEGTRR